ncbi:MAG: methyltransferase domain-containing protein [Candidatus Krumholzibacteriota bacterium]|nr:methyltransferase domain-containing protein [Candidatus Krumholzibacteriota bacterium]
MPEIRSDYSAQRINAQPNPMFIKLLSRMSDYSPECARVVDLGCGKLRHLVHLRECYRDITLVDTAHQLSATHKLGSATSTIPMFVDGLRKRKGEKLSVIEFGAFAKAKSLRVHAVFCVAVFDVVPPGTRRALLDATHRHLGPDGLFVLVVPRNDSSILRRCTHDNEFKDGHVFAHHGVHTFYRNFGDSSALAKWIMRRDFDLVDDLSNYRQIGLVMRRA